MEKLKAIKWNYVIEALIMIAIGVVLIVWPQGSLEIMAKALAILLILVGVVLVVSYIVHKERTFVVSGGLALGLVVAAIGVWIFLNPSPFIDFIPKLFGLFIVVGGIFNLVQTISLIRVSYPNWWLSMIFALVTIIMGGILLFNTKFAENILVTIIGSFLVFDGVTNVWTTSRVSKFARKVSKAVNQAERDADAIDVEARIVDDDAQR